MLHIQNFTPHEVRVLRPDGTELAVIPPSGQVARLPGDLPAAQAGRLNYAIVSRSVADLLRAEEAADLDPDPSGSAWILLVPGEKARDTISAVALEVVR